MANNQINWEEIGKIFKIIGYIILVIIAFTFWYLSIPIVFIWYLYKKDKKLSAKTKLIFSISVTIIFFILGGLNMYSNRAPSLTLEEPQDGISVQSEKIQVKGKVSPSGSKVTINGLDAEVDWRGNFSYDARLKSENNILNIQAINNEKNVTEIRKIARIFTEEELVEIEKQKVLAEREEIEKAKEVLNREISSLNKSFDNSIYRGSSELLLLELALFNAWAQTVNQYKNHSSAEVKDLVKELERKVSQLQTREFPLMRKEYASLLNSKLWSENIEVKIVGSNNKTIEFVGAIFANNKNVATIHTANGESLKNLRFSKANYRWFKYDDEYNYYSIEGLSDGVVSVVN